MNDKPKRTIVDYQKYVHFVTFSCYRRRRLIDLDHPKKPLLGVLNHQLEQMKAKCVGFVVMPDHVHALIWLRETGQLSRFMHGWKRMSSFNIRRWYEESESGYFDKLEMGKRFWQPKYYSFSIYSRRKLKEKLDYIHLNPARAGLVERATDSPWSSARWHDSRRTVDVPVEWVECSV